MNELSQVASTHESAEQLQQQSHIADQQLQHARGKAAEALGQQHHLQQQQQQLEQQLLDEKASHAAGGFRMILSGCWLNETECDCAVGRVWLAEYCSDSCLSWMV